MKKFLLLAIVIISTSSILIAQKALLKGKVINAETKQPINEITITLPKAKITTSTNSKGEFSINGVPYGNQKLILTDDLGNEESIDITVNATETILDDIEIKPLPTTGVQNNNDANTSNIEDATGDDDNEGNAGQNISSTLNASRDPFLNAVTGAWGAYFFKIRGYDNDQNQMILNGVPMNDLEEGNFFYNSWSGLNDVFRSKTVSLGLQPNEFSYGGYGLTTVLDATASQQRKQTKLTYSLTNRMYRNRIMLTHSSGLNKKGWAYSVSFSRRWANEGAVKGTFYDSYGYYAAIEKRFKTHGINLMLVGAPIKRGKVGPATREAFELAGTNYYNPNWGYQNGKVRNTRINQTHVPILLLTHEAALNTRTNLTTAISYSKGETAQTSIDWYNSADPRPDYYRYMPSYIDSSAEATQLANLIKANPDKYLQVDWDGFYEANYLNKIPGNGRSLYIVGADIEQQRKLNAGITIQSNPNNHLTFYSGISYQNQKNTNFKRVEDLLGGSYWLNINQFAERDYKGNNTIAQNNVLNPNLRCKVGDQYGYNYNVFFQKAAWWSQAVFNFNNIDLFLTSNIGFDNYYRKGNYLSGLYQATSYGQSSSNRFFVYGGKGGITYKINGRNYIYANGGYNTKAPYFDNIFISARTRNQQSGYQNTEKVTSGEVGYLFRAPALKARISAYATQIKDATDIKRYYDGDFNSFVNYVLKGIQKRHTGIEAGAEIKVTPSLTVNIAAALGQSYYTSRPNIDIYRDNDTTVYLSSVKSDTVYMRDYYVSAGPQTALNISFNYRSKRFWFANLSANYMDNNWIDFAAPRRTTNAVDLVTYQSTKWGTIINQEKLPSFYTLDFFGGKSFKVDKYIKSAGRNTFLNIQIGVTNILNNKKIIQYGFENLRYDKEHPNWFATKYTYALPLQYMLNVSLRF